MKSMRNASEQSWSRELKEFDLRATPARIAVLVFLGQTKEPVDVVTIADFLHRKKILTNPATIFRMMNTFTQKGITISVQFQEGKTRYELAGKGDHHHLICEKCGNIEDLENCILPSLEKSIQKNKHFLVKRHMLEFYGLCPQCQ